MEDDHVATSTVSLAVPSSSSSPGVILRGVRVPCVHAYTVNSEEMSQPLAYAYSLAPSTCHTNTINWLCLAAATG